MMKKVKKKKKKKRKVRPVLCDVPDCDRPFFTTWEGHNRSYVVCRYHFRRHVDGDDSFNLLKIFNIQQLELGVSVDRFGSPYINTFEVKKKIKKVRWKSSRLTARPKSKSTTNQEVESTIDDILGN